MSIDTLVNTTIDMIPFVKGNRYLESLSILILFFILSEIIVFLFEKVVLKLAIKTKTQIDDKIVRKANKPISIILLLFGLRLAIETLDLPEIFNGITTHLLYSFIVIVFVYIIIISIDIIIDEWGKNFAKRTKSTIDEQLLALFHRFSRILISIVGFLFILRIWGFEIGPLLASLGIIGIAVAFALQSTLGNIFGGVSIILDKSVRVGDIVKIDEETTGEVIDVGLRSTKIKTMNNEMVTMPNGKLADSKINNFMQPDPKVRAVVDFGVEYGSDVDKVKDLVIKEMEKNKHILKDPEPSIRLYSLGDFALQFKAYFWTTSHRERVEEEEIIRVAIYNTLNKNKIGIPFPTRTIYMKKE